MKKLFCLLLCALLLPPACGAVAEDAADPYFSTVIAASGSTVWQIRNGCVVCADAESETESGRLDLRSLPAFGEAGAEPEWLSLISRDENGVRLCAAVRNAGGEIRVWLYELAAGAGGPSADAGRDVTEALGAFWNAGADWLEIDMTGCDNGYVFIAALDSSQMFHLFGWNPAEGAPAALGTAGMSAWSAAVPRGSGILAVGFSQEDPGALTLAALDPATGEREKAETLPLDTDPWAAINFALKADENLLCFTVGSTAYRVTPGTGAMPEPFAVLGDEPVMNLNGVIAGNRYVLYGTDGTLVYTDLRARPAAARIRVYNTTEDEGVQASAALYNASQSRYVVSVAEGREEEGVLESLLNGSADYDLYMISMSTELYRAIKKRGYYADLGGSETLRAAVADMPEAVRAAVTDGEKLAALPLAADSECLLVNTRALSELAGISRDELPTDWPGFLALLNRIAADGILKGNSALTISDVAATTGELKEMLLTRLLADAFLWMEQEPGRETRLREALLPALQALDRLDLAGLGLPEDDDADADWTEPGGRTALLSDVHPEIAVMSLPEGTEYMPLALEPGGEGLIGQNVTVMFANPWGTDTQAAADFAGFAWEHQDILSRMTLSQSLNEPVVNEAYNEEIAYLEQIAASYEAAVAAAASAREAEALRQEAAETTAFLEDYRLYAHYLASAESIADYRALAGRTVPAAPEFWSADNEDAAILQYLDGLISAEQLASRLDEALQMTRMEGD